MTASELRLSETIHPHRDILASYEDLVAIDEIKQALVAELTSIFDKHRIETWRKKHHAAGLKFFDRGTKSAPLIILAGDVGCGKSALASCVASAVGKAIDQRIAVFETPSDIRGTGHVGELSTRLTDAFSQARTKAARTGRGILIIDEADDLATRRGQMQAHHEDRAGVNVLIKQLDQMAKETTPMAVIMITNRADVLDPAVLRRAVLILEFKRPDDKGRAAVFKHILEGTGASASDIAHLVKLTGTKPTYTFSDLTVRLARTALRRAMEANEPFGADALAAAVAEVKPSPLMEEGRAP